MVLGGPVDTSLLLLALLLPFFNPDSFPPATCRIHRVLSGSMTFLSLLCLPLLVCHPARVLLSGVYSYSIVCISRSVTCERINSRVPPVLTHPKNILFPFSFSACHFTDWHPSSFLALFFRSIPTSLTPGLFIFFLPLPTPLA